VHVTFVVASSAVHDLVRDHARSASVVAVNPSAVYLETGDHRLVALLTRDAVRVPIGMVTATLRRDAPFDRVRPGQPARIGDGELRFDPADGAGGGPADGYRPLRYWDPRVPRLRAALGSSCALRRVEALAVLTTGLAPAEVAHWLDAAGPLAGALAPRRPDDAQLAAAVGSLLGCGPGLTPAGDDVLAGALVALAAAGDEPRRAALVAAVRGAVGRPDELLDHDRVLDHDGVLDHDKRGRGAGWRTTLVSAALLEQACLARAVPEVSAVLRALAGAGDLDAALARLAAVGHTSGAALALGVGLALGAHGHGELGRCA
jgi:hypothetical protein